MKSERKQCQEKIVAYLNQNIGKFDAPYGILEGLQPFGKGQIRTITFGVARYLDSVIKIIKPNKIIIEGQGALAYKYDGSYKSAEEVIEALKGNKEQQTEY